MLTYKKEENITNTVKSLDKDKSILRNIPHQPGELSALPFKLTTTCNPNKQGDYYDYYTGSTQLSTIDTPIDTTFSHIKISKLENVMLTRIKPPLTIHKQYITTQLKPHEEVDYDKGFCFLLKGGMRWGEFIQDWLPYLFFAKQLLLDNPDMIIICKEIEFDSYNYIISNILGLINKSGVLKINNGVKLKKLYYIDAQGPFASGLFPYQGHCTCPVSLYRQFYNHVHTLPLDNNSENNTQKLLIYAKRNTGNARRNIANEDEIENMLKEYCNQNEYEYIGFYYGDYSIENRIKLFNRADIVVGVHGSCMFHTLFCKPNTKVIEFVCIKDCHSTQLTNLSYGHEYWQIPIPEHGQFEKVIKVSDESIQSLKTILYLPE